MNLSTRSTEMLVVVESLPEVVDTPLARLGSCVEKADDVGLQMLPDGVEEPAMRVDLLHILLFETARNT